MPAVATSPRPAASTETTTQTATETKKPAGEVSFDDIAKLQKDFEEGALASAKSFAGGAQRNLENSKKELAEVSGWGAKSMFSWAAGTNAALEKQIGVEEKMAKQTREDAEAKQQALEYSKKLAAQAKELEEKGDHKAAQAKLTEARSLLNPKSKIDYSAYMKGLQDVNKDLAHADKILERTETGMRITRDATVVVAATAATVATGGVAGVVIGTAVGVGVGTASNVTEQVGHVAYGNKTADQAIADGKKQFVADAKSAVTSAVTSAVAAPVAGKVIGAAAKSSSTVATALEQTAVRTVATGATSGAISGAGSTSMNTAIDVATGQREFNAKEFGHDLLKSTVAGAAGGAIGAKGSLAKEAGASAVKVTLAEGAADIVVSTGIEVADATVSGREITVESLGQTIVDSVKGTIQGEFTSRAGEHLKQQKIAAAAAGGAVVVGAASYEGDAPPTTTGNSRGQPSTTTEQPAPQQPAPNSGTTSQPSGSPQNGTLQTGTPQSGTTTTQTQPQPQVETPAAQPSRNPAEETAVKTKTVTRRPTEGGGPQAEPETTTGLASPAKAQAMEEDFLARYSASVKKKNDAEPNPKKHGDVEGLNNRYNDDRSHVEHVNKSLDEVAKTYKVDTTVPEHLRTASLDSPEVRQQLRTELEAKARKLFEGNEEGARTFDKQRMVLDETATYLKHVEDAIAQGQLPPGVKAGDVYELVQKNLLALRLQETAAQENALGDHGVRHLVDHNIGVCETVAKQLKDQGVELTPIDHMILHQVMIDHDLGYAMDSVRNPINTEGLRGQDAGHNVLAARFVREWAAQPDSPLSKVFTPDALDKIHHAILYHDKGPDGNTHIKFSADPTVSKTETLTGLVQLADNTAAFSQKLAGVLYENPETLKYMRLLKTAHETGNEKLAGELRNRLVEHIEKMEGLSEGDRKALALSAKNLATGGYKFSVGRICGNEAEYTATRTPGSEDIQIDIKVRESNIHQQIVSLFETQQYEQLAKFVKDVTNNKVDIKQMPDASSAESPHIKISIRPEPDGKQHDVFEDRVGKIIDEPEFVQFSKRDAKLGQDIEYINKLIKLQKEGTLSETDFRKAAAGLLPNPKFAEGSLEQVTQALTTTAERMKGERDHHLQTYMESQL